MQNVNEIRELPNTIINGIEVISVGAAALAERIKNQTLVPHPPVRYTVWFNTNFPQGLPAVDPNAPVKILTPNEYAVWHRNWLAQQEQNLDNLQNNAQPTPVAPTINISPVAEDMEPKINNNNDTTGEPNAKRKKLTSPVGENLNLLFAQSNSKPDTQNTETEEDETEQKTKSNSSELKKSPRSGK